MISILEYIMSHYTLFLGGAIIILLAIIGRYADKTNFGQGKTKESNQEKTKEVEESNKFDTLQAAVENMQDKEIQLSNTKEVNVTEQPVEKELQLPEAKELNIIEGKEPSVLNKQEIQVEENIVSTTNSTKEIEKEFNFEEKFDRFDREFNEILPKKETIDDQILDEIENLSLDKTQKIDLTDIPSLDDVELPKIKNIKPEIDDIWKF